MYTRRSLITGAASLVAYPAIAQLAQSGAGSSGSGAVINPLRTAVTQNRLLSSSDHVSGSSDVVNLWSFVIAQDCSSLVLSYNNFWLNSTNEHNPGNTVAIVSSAMYKQGAASTVPVQFSGGRTKTLADGDVDIQSDVLLPASFGLTKFTAGEVYWLKSHYQLPNGTTAVIPFCAGRNGGTFLGQAELGGGWFNPANTTPSTTDAVGSYTATGTAFGTHTGGFFPLILGTPIVDQPSWLTIGDSVTQGIGDTGSFINGLGYVQRASVDGSGLNPIPMLNFGINGTKTSNYLSANSPKQATLWKYANRAFSETAINDLGNPATSGTLATCQADLGTLRTQLNSAGFSKILRSNLYPRTTSTDLWATLVNQTPLTGWTLASIRGTFNTWVGTEVSNGHYLASVDINTVVSDAVSTDVFKVNGTANFATTDGTHPTAAFHTLMASNALRPALLAAG